MKVLKRAEFLALQHKVIYAELREGTMDFGPLHILCGASGSNDFVSIPLGVEIDSPDSESLWGKIEQLRQQQAEFKYCDDNSSRDGTFDGDEVRFLVFDRRDTQDLVKQLIDVCGQIPVGF